MTIGDATYEAAYADAAEKSQNRPQGCTCRFIPNTSSGWAERDSQGCPLHCTHRGIVLQRGARCWCGAVYDGWRWYQFKTGNESRQAARMWSR